MAWKLAGLSQNALVPKWALGIVSTSNCIMGCGEVYELWPKLRKGGFIGDDVEDYDRAYEGGYEELRQKLI